MRQIELRSGVIEYEDRGSGPPVVLLHGIHTNETLWDGVITRLEGDCRCLAPALPLGGHRRALYPGADLTASGITEMIADFLDAMGMDDVTVVGIDTGGAFAQLLVTRRPQRVGRLVLVSCDAFDNWPPGLPGKFSAFNARLPGGLFLAGQVMRVPAMSRLPMAFGWMAKHGVPANILESWFAPLRRDRGIRHDMRTFLRSLDRRELLDNADKLASFDRPTLIAWASEDRVMPPEHAHRLAALLPNARVTEIADSYTLLPLDQPDALAAHIHDFVHGDR